MAARSTVYQKHPYFLKAEYGTNLEIAIVDLTQNTAYFATFNGQGHDGILTELLKAGTTINLHNNTLLINDPTGQNIATCNPRGNVAALPTLLCSMFLQHLSMRERVTTHPFPLNGVAIQHQPPTNWHLLASHVFPIPNHTSIFRNVKLSVVVNCEQYSLPKIEMLEVQLTLLDDNTSLVIPSTPLSKSIINTKKKSTFNCTISLTRVPSVPLKAVIQCKCTRNTTVLQGDGTFTLEETHSL